MTEQSDEISFRLHVRRDRTTSKWWLAAPLKVGGHVTLWLVPNTIALRSVIAPPAWRLLRLEGLIGADIVDFRSGHQTCVLRDTRVGGHDISDLVVQVREVEEMRLSGDRYAVDGYLGLDFFLMRFATVTLDTRRLRLTLRLKT